VGEGGTSVGVRVGGIGVEEGGCVWVDGRVAVDDGATGDAGGSVGAIVGFSRIGFSLVAVG
jgi:hypothetical protein